MVRSRRTGQSCPVGLARTRRTGRIRSFVDRFQRGMSPPGMLATRIARGAVVPAGRAARRSRANVRHPAVAQARTVRPFVLDRLPGPPACRPRSVAGRGRAFGACCFAGKLRSPAGPGPAPPWPRRLTPTSFPPSFPTRAGCVPPRWPEAPFPLVMPPRGASRPQKPRLAPLGGVERALGKVRFARLIHSGARVLGGPGGPRRLRRHLSLTRLPLRVVRSERRVVGTGRSRPGRTARERFRNAPRTVPWHYHRGQPKPTRMPL
jgi:hypothetical protein